MEPNRHHVSRVRFSRFLGVALLGAMLSFGVACSDDGGDDGETEDTSTPTTTATSTPETTPTGTPASATPPSAETPQTTSGGAAGGGIEPANPEAPPEGALVSSAGEVDLGLGSYCWSPPAGSGSPAMCADAIGIITGTTDLPVSAGETLTITGDLPWPPMTIESASLWQAPAEPVASEADWRAWQPFGPEGEAQEPQTLEADSSTPGEHTVTLPADLEPGRYLLSLFYTAGPDRGSDATYGAILVVE